VRSEVFAALSVNGLRGDREEGCHILEQHLNNVKHLRQRDQGAADGNHEVGSADAIAALFVAPGGTRGSPAE